nr:uncharacterized protein LOC109170919 [Ipomoea trifida]
MDVESTFRVMFGVKKEQDMVELIEAAVSVASLIAPHKLKKHRSRIVKLLFDEDPANASHDLFSDDELGLDSDDDDELLKPKNTSHSPEIKKLGFGKKSVKESQVVAPQMTPLKMEGRQEKSMEAPKKMLGRKYPEEEEGEAEKKGKKRKIDFPEPKKHFDDRNKAKLLPSFDDRNKAKLLPSGHVRSNELKARTNGKPKPKSKY